MTRARLLPACAPVGAVEGETPSLRDPGARLEFVGRFDTALAGAGCGADSRPSEGACAPVGAVEGETPSLRDPGARLELVGRFDTALAGAGCGADSRPSEGGRLALQTRRQARNPGAVGAFTALVGNGLVPSRRALTGALAVRWRELLCFDEFVDTSNTADHKGRPYETRPEPIGAFRGREASATLAVGRDVQDEMSVWREREVLRREGILPSLRRPCPSSPSTRARGPRRGDEQVLLDSPARGE